MNAIVSLCARTRCSLLSSATRCTLRAPSEKSDHRHALLRPRRERPGDRRAAEQRDERAPFHSITSSCLSGPNKHHPTKALGPGTPPRELPLTYARASRPKNSSTARLASFSKRSASTRSLAQATSKPLMMRFIIAAPDEVTLSRRNPQFRISISGSTFDLRYQRISEAACDIRHLSFLRFLRTEEIYSGESAPQLPRE